MVGSNKKLSIGASNNMLEWQGKGSGGLEDWITQTTGLCTPNADAPNDYFVGGLWRCCSGKRLWLQEKSENP